MLEVFPTHPNSNIAANVPNDYRREHSGLRPYWLIGKKGRTIFLPKRQHSQQQRPGTAFRPDVG
jgi:hypothetical protein